MAILGNDDNSATNGLIHFDDVQDPGGSVTFDLRKITSQD